MPLELKILLVETDSGDRGWSTTPLGPEAAQLTKHSFMVQYAMPAIAQAWVSLANSVEARQARAHLAALDRVNGQPHG